MPWKRLPSPPISFSSSRKAIDSLNESESFQSCGVRQELGMAWNDLSWLKSNRPLLISQVIGIPIVVAWLLYFYFDTHNAFALVLVFLVPVFVVINLVMVNRGRARIAESATRRESLTGHVVASERVLSSGPESTQSRWIGAADVPGSLGRTNATYPLAVLEVEPGKLTLQIRPKFLAAMFGIKALEVSPADVEAVFPARARLHSRAIAIRPKSAPPSYFILQGDRDSILRKVALAGFLVSLEERKYSAS
jgi:hypothetical protein